MRPSVTVGKLHGLFVDGKIDAKSLHGSTLRGLIADSWQRSLATGVNPDGEAPAATLALQTLRERHPLAPVMPTIRKLLVDDASESSGVMVAVGASDGTLLWVEGDSAARRRAETMNFMPGAVWSESAAGTNAPGTALALDREVQIRGSEHFARAAHRWSCTAVPIHDPTTRQPIGVLDVTGGVEVATPQTLALLRATAMAVEGQLAVLRLTGDGRPASRPVAGLHVLGAGRPTWVTHPDGGAPHVVPLTGRHADILVLLARHPEGLSGDHLALLLDEGDLDTVTVRAEMSRLRKAVGAQYLGSRPYRLLEPVDMDADAVATAVRSGAVGTALDRYPGPLLPNSIAPGVARLRTELSETLRAAVFETRDLRILRRWLDLPDGRDDQEGWLILHRHGGAGGRAEAGGHLAGLEIHLS
ncbi:helix-turn-helix domain-containing protein [Tsukamurella soli]|uniref:helix-turn-helix domain-containing protein n=1 Tax=Tsukamurella soli TaxID=644556 RepID=UPI0031E572BC